MCGICGIWKKENASLSDLETMMQGLTHRGPDDSGIYKNNLGMLGHRRLSIMDPKEGKQPIFNEDKSLAVLANGEIYNFPELYKKLQKTHRFRTKNDSEALVHLFEDYGAGMLDYIEGMFAFCITDGNDIFLARDQVGIKPLYYQELPNDGFFFSSELKNIAGYEGVIHEFPPGAYYRSGKGFKDFHSFEYSHEEIREYIDGVHQQFKKESDRIAHFSSIIKDTLCRAVEKRLMSDVPLGSFLSGGLDSSIIAAVAAQRIPHMHTFSVGRTGSSDLPAARTVSEHIGSMHHEYILTEDEVIEKLPEIIYSLESFDQDLVRSAIPCYFTSRLASDYVKVILTGEGADELFGGYTYYKDIEDDRILEEELVRSVSSLHNLNLQRVDRLTMAHSIEGRVPFLDLEVIELSLKIPAEYKLERETMMEKWILRKAFDYLLPEQIVWRKKEQFDEGSGIADLMTSAVEKRFSDSDAETHKKGNRDIFLRSKEEVFYHKLFTEVFHDPAAIYSNVGRWAERPEHIG
jgi:asparagine synthase (glutamine-hydrolysing)